MVSISGRPKVLPIIGYFFQMNSLKLEHSTAKYKFKGLLPYDKELNEPQLNLLLYIIEQNSSRDAIVNILSLNKAKDAVAENLLSVKKESNTILENLLIELFMTAIIQTCQFELLNNVEFDKLDFTDSNSELNQIVHFWNHISTNVLYFEFQYQIIDFIECMTHLFKRISNFNSIQASNKMLLKCREFFMWTLLQIVSAFIHFSPVQLQQPNSNIVHSPVLTHFTSIFKFIDLFYHEKEPLALPDFSKQNSVYIMSAASIWLLISKKFESDSVRFNRKIPVALKTHVDFLQEIINNSNSPNSSSEYLLAILCNSCKFSTKL